MAAGRPSDYTPELGAKICARIAEGESVRSIGRDNTMPNASTIHAWVLEDKEGFSKQYERAKNLQAENMFEELLDIADDGTNDWVEREYGNGNIQTVPDNDHISRSRLRVDTRKWYLSKVLPKKFGDKNTLVTEDEHGNQKAITSNTIIFKEYGSGSEPEV